MATKQTRKRNAAGRFEARAEGTEAGGVTKVTGGKVTGGAKREMQKKVKDAWPDITDILVETAKKGDFRATKWLWEESGLGNEMPKRKRGSKPGFAQTLIDEFKSQQARARQLAMARQQAAGHAAGQRAAGAQKTEPTK